MPADVIAQRILRFVQGRGYKPQQMDELARTIGIAEDEAGDFRAACKALMRTGRIVLGDRSALMLPPSPDKIIGSFRKNPRGFGFVIPNEPNAHGDLFIPPGKSGGALTGDTVVAEVRSRGKRDGAAVCEGRIVSVLSRGQSRFVGELNHKFGKWFVVPDGNTLHVPILVGDPGAKGARPSDQVVVEIVQYPEEGKEARGAIVKILGPRGEPGVELQSIIEQYQLPQAFPEDALQQAREAAQNYDPEREIAHRDDLRELTIVTIDPTDARDFDDAISLTRVGRGVMELGIHIADVAHFVPEGSPLDEEAVRRSNSVYLPGMVIPMLPEVLSNEVCSLQERQPRLTKSAFITYDAQGRVLGSRFSNSMIRSAKRLTYEQASAVLEGRTARVSAKVVALLKDMGTLANAIRKRRLREGMMELDLPEIELVYDADGRVKDVVPADTSFSHKLIEMFMVEANEAVARQLSSLKVPFLRRVHDAPSPLAIDNLQRFLIVLGFKLNDRPDRHDLQALLDKVRGKEESFPVHLAVLRSMKMAEYAPLPIGHFALASEDYCHFTSPIRRYPDLTIHRLLDAHLTGRLKGAARRDVPSEKALTQLGSDCGGNERRAEAAERELKLVMVLRLLENKLGERYAGVVTGVANVGVFVQLRKFLVDGLIRFDQLADDWWDVDSKKGTVTGQRSGQRITVGDRVDVIISRVDIAQRQLEVAPAGKIGKKMSGKSKGTPAGRRGKRGQQGRRSRSPDESRSGGGRVKKPAKRKGR